jgi:chorismate mutase
MDEELKALRAAISSIDDDLIKLAAQRLDVARRVGEYKALHGLPVKDFEVEKQIIDKTRERAKSHGVYGAMAESLVKILIKYSVIRQAEVKRPLIRQELGKGKRILVVGGGGQMGRWFANFLDSMGHSVSVCDERPIDGEEVRFPVVPLLDSLGSHDIILFATPLATTAQIMKQCLPSAGKARFVEISSLKSHLVPVLDEARTRGTKVACIHPMFGPSVDLLADCSFLLCEGSDPEALAEIRSILGATPARLIAISLADHDRLMGVVLGAPHLMNLVFASYVARSGFGANLLQNGGGTTFKNLVGVAQPVLRENQDLYYDIQKMNSSTPEMLGALRATIQLFDEAVKSNSSETFKALMTDAGRFFDEGMA